MLLQTNSYIVPKDKRSDHMRLMRRFRQALAKLGCDLFEVYEQVGANWNGADSSGRYVQIMRFRDRKHQLSVQNAERSDPLAQGIISEFCELVNFPYQQQQGFFAVGFYNSVLSSGASRTQGALEADGDDTTEEFAPLVSTALEPLPEESSEAYSDQAAEAPAQLSDHDAEPAAAEVSPADDIYKPGDPFDFEQSDEPLSEEELARELMLETPPPAPPATPPPPAPKPGMFRRPGQ